jgi:hypothetical protein
MLAMRIPIVNFKQNFGEKTSCIDPIARAGGALWLWP